MNEQNEPDELYERTTKKSITSLPTLMNEKEYAQWKYDHALAKMLADPTLENREAFDKANEFLYEVQNRYHIGAKRLLLKAQEKEAAFSRKIIDAHITKGKTKPGKLQAAIAYLRSRL